MLAPVSSLSSPRRALPAASLAAAATAATQKRSERREDGQVEGQEGEEGGIMRGIPSGSVRIVADDDAECDRGAAAFFAFFDRKSRTRDAVPVRLLPRCLTHTSTHRHIVRENDKKFVRFFEELLNYRI